MSHSMPPPRSKPNDQAVLVDVAPIAASTNTRPNSYATGS